MKNKLINSPVRVRILKFFIITFLVALAIVIPIQVSANGPTEEVDEPYVSPYGLTLEFYDTVDTCVFTLPNYFYQYQNNYNYGATFQNEQGQQLTISGSYNNSTEILTQGFSNKNISSYIKFIFTDLIYTDFSPLSFTFDYMSHCKYSYELDIYDYENNNFDSVTYEYNSSSNSFNLFSVFQYVSYESSGIYLGGTRQYNNTSLISNMSVTITEITPGDSFDNFSYRQQLVLISSYRDLLRQCHFEIKNNYKIGDFGTQLLTAANNFLKFEIVDGFSLLDLLFTIVTIPLLIFIIKLFMGG